MGSGISMIIVVVMMGAFMYFGMMRPQKKQQQQRQQMLSDLKKGDKIITIGGLHGEVDSINREKNTVDLNLDGVYLTFNLTAIRSVNADTPSAPAKKTETKTEEKTESDDKGYSEDEK